MDGLSLAASVVAIIQLTGICLRLSSKILGPSKNSSKDLQNLSSTLYAFNGSIKNLQTHLEICEEDEARLSALEYLSRPLTDCTKALTLLENYLKNPSLLGRHIIGARFDSKMEKCLSALDHSRTLFTELLLEDQQIMLSAVERYTRNIGEDIRDLSQRTEQNHDQLRNQYEALASNNERIDQAQDIILSQTQDWRADYDQQKLKGKNDALLEWLSSANFEAKQSDALSRRHQDTGSWFINHATFEDWVRGPARTLWCPGIPGAGKTILAALIVDHLRTRFRMTDTAVVCVFCNYAEQQSQSVQSVLENLLKQLLQASSAASKEAMDLYQEHSRRRTRPTENEVLLVLLSVFQTSSTVFVVIDALDELSTETRTSLLHSLCVFDSHAHFLITSRPLQDITVSPPNLLEIVIRADEHDVSTYVVAKLQDEERLRSWSKDDKNLQKEIIEKVVGEAQGMQVSRDLYFGPLY